jgi:hypothetical protein
LHDRSTPQTHTHIKNYPLIREGDKRDKEDKEDKGDKRDKEGKGDKEGKEICIQQFSS